MNIRTVSRAAVYDIAHQSSYVYGVSKDLLPPKAMPVPEDVTLPGRGHIETTYKYSFVSAWLDDVPVVFTFLNAQRSYAQTQQVFSDYSAYRRNANTSTNSWLV